jgi:hypothetical protein
MKVMERRQRRDPKKPIIKSNAGNYYYIGANTGGELQSFFNVAASLGVSVY